MDFIVNNYLIILIVGAFLIFALIGYVVDSTKNRKNKEEDLLTKPNDELDVNLIKEEPSQEESLKEDNFTEDVTSAPIEQDNSEDMVNMNMDN